MSKIILYIVKYAINILICQDPHPGFHQGELDLADLLEESSYEETWQSVSGASLAAFTHATN